MLYLILKHHHLFVALHYDGKVSPAVASHDQTAAQARLRQHCQPADPDACYNKHRGTGYLVQITETFAEDDSAEQKESEPRKPDLITHVAVDKLTMHDKDALIPAIESTARRGIMPQELPADSHYGSNECLETGRERDVEIISPAMTAKGKHQGKLTLEDIELDGDGRVLLCPMGQVPLETSVADVRIQAIFDSAVCEGCPRKGDCPAAAVGRRERRWQYTHERVLQRARRLHDTSEEFRD